MTAVNNILPKEVVRNEWRIEPFMNRCQHCDKILVNKNLCNSCRANHRRFELKKKCLAYKGNKCLVCDYKRCSQALHFHHLDPSAKEFTISGKHCKSESSILEELNKCVLLCCRCHSEHHAGIIDVVNYIHKDITNEEAFKLKIKQPKVEYKCFKCGAKIFKGSNKCTKCQGELCRRFEITKEELEQLIQKYSYTHIGKMFGVSDNAIRKRAKKLGIEI